MRYFSSFIRFLEHIFGPVWTVMRNPDESSICMAFSQVAQAVPEPIFNYWLVITHAETRIARDETPGVNISQKPDILRNQILDDKRQGCVGYVGAGRGAKATSADSYCCRLIEPPTVTAEFPHRECFFVHFSSFLFPSPPFMSY